MLCSVDSAFSVGDYMLSDTENVPFEGVTLDILHGNAVFVSGLTSCANQPAFCPEIKINFCPIR